MNLKDIILSRTAKMYLSASCSIGACFGIYKEDQKKNRSGYYKNSLTRYENATLVAIGCGLAGPVLVPTVLMLSIKDQFVRGCKSDDI